MKKVLLVEDDTNLSFMITDGLEEEGFEVLHFAEGLGAIRSLTCFMADIVLLDVNLKGSLNGFETAGKIRLNHKNLPILFITSRSQLEDLKQGFSIGNMDYLKKPFGMGELFLRINELLSKNQSIKSNTEEKDLFNIGKYGFTPTKLSLHFDGETIQLRKTECEVLKLLCKNKDNILKKNDILEQVWCTEDHKSKEASLDNVLHALRTKLSKDKSVEIKTIPRFGYILKIEENA